jgi:hypothetical protein
MLCTCVPLILALKMRGSSMGNNKNSSSSSFLGFTAQLRPWPPPQNPAEFLGGFSTIFFFTG